MSGLSTQLWCSYWLKAEQLHPERSPHQSNLQPSSRVFVWEEGDAGGRSLLFLRRDNQTWTRVSRFRGLFYQIFFLNKLFKKIWICPGAECKVLWKLSNTCQIRNYSPIWFSARKYNIVIFFKWGLLALWVGIWISFPGKCLAIHEFWCFR